MMIDKDMRGRELLFAEEGGRKVRWGTPWAYFLTDEKVGKESPRTFRMVLGLSRRPKGEADGIAVGQHFRRFPLGNPLGRLREKTVSDRGRNDTE